MSTRRKPTDRTRTQPLRSSTASRPSLLQSQEPSSPPPTFFNTSFSTHRLSPLHTGYDDLPASFLASLAQRLRDILVGDTVRGVYVGLEGEDSELGRVGSLESITVDWVAVRDLVGGADRARRALSLDLSSDAPVELDDVVGDRKGLWVEILYDSGVVYEALMLPALGEDGGEEMLEQSWSMMVDEGEEIPAGSMRFLRLPLLLTRMNVSLRVIFMDWLCSEFDCRVGPLRMGTRTLVRIWERWIRDTGLEHGGGGKDLAITLGFHLPPETEDDKSEPQGIRTIDVMISPSDLRRFITAGKSIPAPQSNAPHWKGSDMERRHLAGDNDEEGWRWRQDAGYEESQPFMEALGRYLDRHLALDLFHPGVRITRVACAGFVLTEGRVKIFQSGQRAVGNLLADLGRRGRGEGIPRVF